MTKGTNMNFPIVYIALGVFFGPVVLMIIIEAFRATASGVSSVVNTTRSSNFGGCNHSHFDDDNTSSDTDSDSSDD